MSQQVAVITGAGQGLGLELCRQLLRHDFRVFACPRRSGSEGLATLLFDAAGNLEIVPMDVGDPVSIAGAIEQIQGKTEQVDLLFNNAGIYPKGGGIESLDFESLEDAFRINTLGALRVTQALLPLLRAGVGKRIAHVTSLMGSIADNGSGGSYAYRISKTALNMAHRSLAHELGPEGFFCVTLHPGWVETRMGGGGAPMNTEESVQDMLDNVLHEDRSRHGGFFGPGGRELPW